MSNEPKPLWSGDETFAKTEHARYAWDEQGFLRKHELVVENANPKYGDASSTTTFEHDRAGRPIRLHYSGRVKDPKGTSIVHTQEEIWEWVWRDGMLQRLTTTHEQDQSRWVVTLELVWRAGASAVDPFVAHVPWLTWLDAGHRERREMYALLLGGGEGQVSARSTACTKVPFGNETCDETRKLALSYGSLGLLTAIDGPAEGRTTLDYEARGLFRVRSQGGEKPPQTTRWSYDDQGHLESIVEQRETTTVTLAYRRNADGTVRDLRRIHESRDHGGHRTEEAENAWSYPPCE